MTKTALTTTLRRKYGF